MVIGCGIRAKNGVYGPRFRVPFDQIYVKKWFHNFNPFFNQLK
jgi:hypothetical protein